MRRFLAALCLLLVAGALFAGVKGVVNFKPQFKFDNTPAADVARGGYNSIGWKKDTGNQLDNWYMTKQDYWLEAFREPGLLDLGLVAQGDKFGVVFIMDFRTDPIAYFLEGNKGNWSNIPFLKHMIELNFPRLGYIDYLSTDGNFYVSVGRRQVKWGPATYDMAIADSQPYLDNFNATITVPMNNGWNFWYNFMGIAYKYFLNYGKYLDASYVADPDYTTWGPKSTFTHKFAMENDKLRFSFAELNVVYGKDPSLLDFSPTVVWHNNYQDDFSNVMLSFTAEGKIGPVRAFANFTMDDYDLPHENAGSQKFNSSKPAAIGVVAGIEVNLLDGEEIESSKFNYQDYVLKEKTFKSETGLNIGYELYYCSKFMYNRNHDVGKYTSPFQFFSFNGGYCFDTNAFYLGFKYGPDTLLHRIYAEYTNNPLKVWGSLEILKRGSYGIDSTYTMEYFNANLETPYDITAPVTTVLLLEAGASYYLQEGFRLDADLGFTRDITHGTSAFRFSIGASIAVWDVDWKNLF